MKYLSDDFLLHSKSAQKLFHEYAATEPILDYHCHLSPRMIAEDASFESITEVWLGGDHYKWRAMRSNGVDENCITGTADDKEKFKAWARTMPHAVRNPLYDWAHLELQRYFGVNDLLSASTEDAIYERCNEKIKDPSFTVRNLLKQMNVTTVCTTDDPVDTLEWHAQLAQEKNTVTVLPTFRPDKAMAIEDHVTYNAYINELEKASGRAITSFDTLLEALDNRHAFFHENGCRCSDHAIETLHPDFVATAEVSSIFTTVRAGKPVSSESASVFRSVLLLELCRMNNKRGWVQQFHFGVLRNVRERIYKSLGPDTGVDCIGDNSFCRPLCRLLDALDARDELTKTMLFNAHPGNNEAIVSIIGAFQDGSVPGKVQLGPPWWFLDQKDGFIQHFKALSGLGLLSRFVGMTTDSRSFLSFPRHEYYRRLLCGMLGDEMERGDLPGDFTLMGGIVRAMSYTNAREYFGY